MTEVVTSTPIVPIVKVNKSRGYGKHDVLDGEYKLTQKILAELLGTTIFVYGVCSCGVFNSDPLYNPNTAVAIIGGACMGGIIIYIFGRVSGAHFNPAVSLALFIRHKLSCLELVAYIVAQIIGGFIGCILLALCRRGRFKLMSANSITDYLIHFDGEGKKNAWCYISALIFEILGTFVLIMFILASCERDNYLGPNLGLAFSATILALSGIGGNISGCSLNPARSFAPAVIEAIVKGGNKDPIKQIWIYIVGPLVGSILAALLWPIFVYVF